MTLPEISELKNVQAEAGIIGTLMVHPDFLEFADDLAPRHFFDRFNGILYQGIRDLYMSGIPNIDDYNLEIKLKSDKDTCAYLENSGQSSLSNVVAMYSANARNSREEFELLLDQVITCSFKRDLSESLRRYDAYMYSHKDANLEEMDRIVNNGLEELIAKYESSSNLQRFGTKIDALKAEMIANRNPDGTIGIPSKIESLNQFATFTPGNLFLIAARMKKGKSVLMLNECVHKLQMGVSVLYVETEMPDIEFFQRAIALIAQVDCKDYIAGRLNAEETRRADEAEVWLKTAPLYRMYDPDMSMDRLYSLVKRLQRTDNLGLVIYDYIKCDELEATVNYNKLGQITNALKNDIAGKLNIPVISAVQLNRQNEVSDSDKISRYASTVIQIDEKTADQIKVDGTECGNYRMKVMINRHGMKHDSFDDSDYIDLFFDAGHMRFTEAPAHNHPKPF